MGPGQLDRRQFERFRDFLYRESGIWVDDRKVALLSNRIRQRVRARNLSDFDEYYRCLQSPSGAEELGHFLDAVTTNETFFFRTRQHFDWLRTTFLADALQEERRGLRGKSFRIWSAGCATGAEPYTIAICLAENRFRLRDWDLTILGTDISEQALLSARAGIYKKRAIEPLSERQLRHYFRATKDESWEVKPAIREMVRFERHNLLDPIKDGRFDCIFIRNVLIYFDRDSKRTVVGNLIRALADGGRLVVGPSEGIYDMLGELRQESPFLYRKG